MDENKHKKDDPFGLLACGEGACFLCGKSLKSNKSDEHVFPRWLQRRHNLWDKTINLLNGTTIQYRNLTIPCCASCNNTHLSRLESRVKSAVENGYEATSALDPLTLYQWFGKIFFGLLRKELKLLVDRRDEEKGTIISEDLITKFSNLHLFLQSIRRPFTFKDDLPFSVLVVNLHEREADSAFHFFDNASFMISGMISDGVGIIVALQDMALLTETYGKYVAQVGGRKLRQVQFAELYAKSLYQVSLLSSSPSFLTAVDDDPSIPVQVNMIKRGWVNEWVQEDYADVLVTVFNHVMNLKIDSNQIFKPPNLVHTWMTDDDGSLLIFDEGD